MRELKDKPALVLALIALVAAMGGSAVALPGTGSIDKNDVKKNAIRSKAIKNGQVAGVDLARDAVTGAKIADDAVGGAELNDGSVGGADIADGGVGGADIADGAVGASELAPTEPYHAVGAPGEPQFYDGGEGDCVWKAGLDYISGTAPAGFRKDAAGAVHLRGVLSANDGPGGDADCDPSAAGEGEDGLVFVLPPGYRPAYFDLSGLAHAIVVAPDAGAELNGSPIPPGGVQSALTGTAALDGVTFEAASGANRSAASKGEASVGALKKLGGW